MAGVLRVLLLLLLWVGLHRVALLAVTGLGRIGFVVFAIIVVGFGASRRNNGVEGGPTELVGENTAAARGDQYNQQNAEQDSGNAGATAAARARAAWWWRRATLGSATHFSSLFAAPDDLLRTSAVREHHLLKNLVGARSSRLGLWSTGDTRGCCRWWGSGWRRLDQLFQWHGAHDLPRTLLVVLLSPVVVAIVVLERRRGGV